MKLLNFEVWFYIYVVSWTKALRYRPNREQCRESRGIVGYMNSFVEKTCVTLATGVSGHVSDRTGKDKETLKTVLVEKPKSRVVELGESVRIAELPQLLVL